jgi:hypothetical protein
MTDDNDQFMTRAEVRQYVTAWNGEIIMGAVAGVFIGVGLITLISDVIDLGIAETFAFETLLGWALFLIAGVLFLFAMLQNRRKRIALE